LADEIKMKLTLTVVGPPLEGGEGGTVAKKRKEAKGTYTRTQHIKDMSGRRKKEGGKERCGKGVLIAGARPESCFRKKTRESLGGGSCLGKHPWLLRMGAWKEGVMIGGRRRLAHKNQSTRMACLCETPKAFWG